MWVIVADYKKETQNTWMSAIGVNDEEWYIQFLYSLYFLIVTMTTVGYGDIKPQNDSERLVVIIIVLITSQVFSFTINQIGTIVQQMAAEK